MLRRSTGCPMRKVLSIEEAMAHPHLREREVVRER